MSGLCGVEADVFLGPAQLLEVMSMSAALHTLVT